MDPKDDSQPADGGGPPPRDSDETQATQLLQHRLQQVESEIEQLKKLTTPSQPMLIARLRTEGSQPEPKPTAARIVNYIVLKQQESGIYVEKEERGPTTGTRSLGNRTKNNLPLQFREYWKRDETRDKVEVLIRSSPLIDLIRGIMEDILSHERSSIWKKNPVQTVTKNVLLLHCFDKLREVADNSDVASARKVTDETREELICLLDNIESYEAEVLNARSDARAAKEISYGFAWTLFKPGTEVVAKLFNDTPQIMVVHRHRPNRNSKDFDIICWTYDWDGRKLARQLYQVTITNFQDTKQINKLECYPLQYHGQTEKENRDFRDELIKRGKLFRNFCLEANTDLLRSSGPVFQAERGRNRQVLSIYESGGMTLKENVDTRDAEMDIQDGSEFPVIIDPLLYTEMNPQSTILGRHMFLSEGPCQCNLCTESGKRTTWEASFKDGTGTLKSLEEYYSLLPPRVLGYIVDRKIWCQFPVESLQRVGYEDHESGWNSLALKVEHKTTIRNLVTAHFRNDRTSTKPKIIRDPIPGKGEGLVILLHGVPGVGKTLTAETLAKVLKRRLLRIDASDFKYSDTAQVSNTFTSYFRMAHNWGCILLLDEADVFLQNRERDEIYQNALVSVLLRHLEYFQGVLMMTTNRVVSVDPAVQSRIHYALQFPHLEQEQMKQIIANLIQQLDESNTEEYEKGKINDWLQDQLEDIRQERINGRDMRNIFTTAQLLALSSDSGKMKLDHIRTVYNSSKRFVKEIQHWRFKLEAQNAGIKQ